jgi:hypothetical protein
MGANQNRFTLVSAFSSDPSEWYRKPYINIHDGKAYKLAPAVSKRSYEAGALTMGDYVRQYQYHPEAKSLAPDGQPCTLRTRGLLLRTPVTSGGIQCIGKETDRHWEQGEDISLALPELMEYTPDQTARLMADPTLTSRVRRWSIRALAKEAGVSENTVKAARRGERLRKSTVSRLSRAVRTLEQRGLRAGIDRR